ncbi:MAG: hypothetical protein AMXMBFR47_09390 [Planctomycetota bacterium]
MHALAAIAVVFGTALIATIAARIFRAPAIIGFLVAGVIIGPTGFDLIHENEVRGFAELGLVMLLFTVGLELSPAPLIQMGARLVIATALQMGVTAAAIAYVLFQFAAVPPMAALVLGLALSPASTAIVLKQLSDRGETDSPSGSIATGILLLQDVAIILAMIVLPLFAGKGEGTWLGVTLRVGGALGGLAAVTWLARAAMPWIVRFVLRDGGRETMALFAVVMAVAGAWASEAAGWSPALGAAIVGLLLASTDVRHQLFAEIMPFREVFNALFFVSIGMLFDWRIAGDHFWLLLGLTLAAMALKSLVAGASVRSAGWSLRLAVIAGLGLVTVSEFGFVIADMAARNGLLTRAALDYLVIVTLLSMVLGTLAMPLARPVADWVVRAGDLVPAHGGIRQPHAAPGRIIVVGFGLNGRNLTSVLRTTRIPHIVLELSPALARAAREAGEEVIVGDAARMTILEHSGLATARAVVVLINDQSATRRIVAQVRRARPDVYLLARTRYVSEIEILRRLGADQVIPEEYETSIEIFAQVLKELGIPDNVIEQQITMIRAGGYGMLRGRPADHAARIEWLRLLDTAATQPFLLPARSPFVGRTIRETGLRARTGVTIVAVTRDGRPLGNPDPEFQLQAGDVLVLVGRHMQLEQARQWLDPEHGRLPEEGDALTV